MVGWVNEARAQNGLPALAVDSRLTYLARLKSKDMDDLNYFAHESPTYGNSAAMLKTFGVSYSGCAENIAHYGSVYKAFLGLMSSPGHYANMMSSSLRYIGVGIVESTDGSYYITQLFIR